LRLGRLVELCPSAFSSGCRAVPALRRPTGPARRADFATLKFMQMLRLVVDVTALKLNVFEPPPGLRELA
jgi:hypothetical protein